MSASASPDEEYIVVELWSADGQHQGFGVVIFGGIDAPVKEGDCGIFVSSIISGSIAADDGRLRFNDRILSINGRSVINVKLHEASNMLSETNVKLTLEISRSCSTSKQDLSETAFQKKNAQAKENSEPLNIAFRDMFVYVVSSDDSAAKQCFSDVQIICFHDKDTKASSGDTQAFNCHRCVLAFMSSTFRTMFSNQGSFVEGSGVVNIDDVPAHIMEDVLSFIYRGFLSTNVDAVSREDEDSLVYAAHKYNIDALVALLLVSISEKLTPSSACRYLLLADRYSFDKLKHACFTVMTKSAQSRHVALNTPEWESVCANKTLITEFGQFHPK